VLDDVGSAFDEGGIDHAVIGGVASSVHGRPRTTKDIDVFLKPRDAESALELLEARNFDSLNRALLEDHQPAQTRDAHLGQAPRAFSARFAR
jgi:hypothetical protein